MENIEMFKWRKELERLKEIEQSKIAYKIIKQYAKKCSTENVIYTGEASLDIFYNFFEAKGTDDEKILFDLLYKYDFEFSTSIHNAIYYLLGKQNELDDLYVNPLSWPGINYIDKIGDLYKLDTNLGKINVYRANEMFNSLVFYKRLMGQCYERTYDFLKENKDYQAVISLMPGFLAGENYHAYLIKDDCVLDIASNAFYDDQESIKTIFCGDELARLTFDEVEEEYSKLKRIYPNLRENFKLHSLAVYYERKRSRK